MYSDYLQQAARLYGDPEGLRTAMLDAGVIINDPIISDGEIHRFKPEGGKSKSGWYVNFGAAGAYGDWRTGIRGTWSANGLNRYDDLRREVQQAQARQRAKIDAKQQQAKSEALKRWRNGDAVTTHEYLIRKQVKPYGIRQINDALVIPVTHHREIWSLQYIRGDGGKRFLPDGRVKGGYYSIGTPHSCIWLAEGFATAATVHEATGEATAAAFNAGNLPTVTRLLKRSMPHIQIHIAADNDEVGLSKARDSLKCGAAGLIAPDIEAGISDWNDFHQQYGLDATREALREAFK